MKPSTIPSEVIWSYLGFGLVVVTGLVAGAARGDWRTRGGNLLIRLGPICYAAPLTGFGIEHFTLTTAIASLIPKWMPWHLFWTYVIGAGFIVGGFSLVTRLFARVSAPLIAMTFFCFVVLMDVPAWLRNPGDPFGLTLALRELAFSGGALAFAATLHRGTVDRPSAIGATIARGFIAVAALVYSVVQFTHATHVPAMPLRPLTPAYIPVRTFWPYFSATVYAVTGVLLLLGRKARAAAIALAASVLVVELAVYLPMAVVERASIVGFNFMADTLMFAGAVLLVAGAMTSDAQPTRVGS